MRATCAACGEALWVGVVDCPTCGEPVEEPWGWAPPELAAEAVSREPTDVAPTVAIETIQAPPPEQAWAVPVHRRGRQWLNVVAVGLVSGVIVAAGLLALELVGPNRSRVLDTTLEERSFERLGFAISYPTGWSVGTEGTGVVESVSFTDPDEPSQRGFRVVLEDVALDRVREDVEDRYRLRRPGYRLIGMTDEEVAGRPTVRHVFADEGLVFEQWWVERPEGTFRIELWSPERDAELAADVHDRIVRSFDPQ